MRIIKGLLASTGILSTILLSTPVQAQEQTNTTSSCSIGNHMGIENRGKCIIRSKVDGNYIYVKIEKSWESPDYFRLTNSPACNTWYMKPISDMKDGCEVEQKYDIYGWDTGVMKFGVYKDENGNETLYYAYGDKANSFHYQGPFKRPVAEIVDPCEGLENNTRC
jgi:hypothetical protein